MKITDLIKSFDSFNPTDKDSGGDDLVEMLNAAVPEEYEGLSNQPNPAKK